MRSCFDLTTEPHITRKRKLSRMAVVKENSRELYYFKIFCNFAKLKIMLRLIKIVWFKKQNKKHSVIKSIRVYQYVINTGLRFRFYILKISLLINLSTFSLFNKINLVVSRIIKFIAWYICSGSLKKNSKFNYIFCELNLFDEEMFKLIIYLATLFIVTYLNQINHEIFAISWSKATIPTHLICVSVCVICVILAILELQTNIQWLRKARD